jgi:hypothetical protein
MSLFKLAVILVLLAIVGSLGHAFFHMMRGGTDSDRVVRALTLRVVLSIGLFGVLVLASAFGLISPHGIGG